MIRKPGIALWGAAVLAAGLFVAQAMLADSDGLTGRLLIAWLAMVIAALLVMGLARRRWRDVIGPPPEPVSLLLAALAALSLWAMVWWLMDMTNYRLERSVGPLPLPQSLAQMPDTLLGVELQKASYEIEILFAVVLQPLALAWLVWGLVQPEIGALVGRLRAAWITGVLAGAIMALIPAQDVAPALPWGLASLGGYMLIGIAAALAVYLTGSPWTGFVAHATFAYASFAWRDDLFREFGGKSYLDMAWLTLVVLGLFGAAVTLQAIRFRDPRPADPERAARNRLAWLGLPLALVLAALVVMTVLDVDARHAEKAKRATAAAETMPANPSSLAPPAPG
ncbi:MAG: hypothetical protein JXJ20_10900 [Anaerolineae bacterium]|nr:hypothetical protein [Anaerolineae bacterium]